MNIRTLAAALSGSSGAPNVVSIDNLTSTGLLGGTAGIVFKTNGEYARYVTGSLITYGNWLSPQSNFGEYEIRFTVTGDALTTGTVDTWMALSTQRSITLVEGTIEGEKNSSVLAEIRWTGNNVVQDSATYTLNANGPI
jgi:hypothetical protein